MNLKRQLLLVSLLTLMLPWAGCEFIRETESALRAVQQEMLTGTARAIAESMAQYPEEFPSPVDAEYEVRDQLFGHALDVRPEIDGYVDDWAIDMRAIRELRGVDGPIRFVVGTHDEYVFLFVNVRDRNVVFDTPQPSVSAAVFSDRVTVTSMSPPYLDESIDFRAEAPGPVVATLRAADESVPAPSIIAHWQDVPGGYQLEARIPLQMLGTHLGVSVYNTSAPSERGVRSSSYSSRIPGTFARPLPEITSLAANLVPRDMRLIVTDRAGWRIANVGAVSTGSLQNRRTGGWLRIAYDALVEPGQEALFAEPDPSGREQQDYVASAINGSESASWFRAGETGRAIVAVASPVSVNDDTIGAVVLQQGTEAILSLTNQGLARLMNVTMIATVLVAGALLGYATWLSRRIRKLSIAAEDALDADQLKRALPSAKAKDEIGDLSRSFSNVLTQLGDYNEYLRTLASKLSHELRTPLTIVTSSLENLEHEPLNDASAEYTARARGGAERLRRILNAMSEASRVEELMANVEPELVDLVNILGSTVDAYRDAYKERVFKFDTDVEAAPMRGSPELLIQMLDKLVDNAVSFSSPGDAIGISLTWSATEYALAISNPGPPLPERMRGQLFDSMVSVREHDRERHLGLGLYIARLIAEGHGGRIEADDGAAGVTFTVRLPA